MKDTNKTARGKLIKDVSALTEVLVNQKSVNVHEHTVKTPQCDVFK